MRLTGVRDEEQRCKGLVFFLLHCHWLLSGSPVVGSIVFLDLYCGLLSVMQKKKKKREELQGVVCKESTRKVSTKHRM